MGGFSNFALSLSIICILAGGVTSFHLGLCSVGGASIGLGWPLVGLFALAVAATMGQLASTFPTAGGLYHWAAILGGRGWGWATAWFNLAGLVTVVAAVNVGTYRFVVGGLLPVALPPHLEFVTQILGVGLITVSQGVINHVGIGATARLTDFSGYWIILVAAALTACLVAFAPSLDPSRLLTFENFSGTAGGGVWPVTEELAVLFALGTLLPAYTITGFDASAHAAEETKNAADKCTARYRSIGARVRHRGLDFAQRGRTGSSQFAGSGRARRRCISFDHEGSASPTVGRRGGPCDRALAQYLCGLATVNSASRMAFAFARDGGLPFAHAVRWVCPRRRSPVVAIWTVAVASLLFTIHTPVYTTITAVCTMFLYISYVLPTALGVWSYGRTWTVMGPWDLGPWYRPLAILSLAGCVVLIVVGMQPPNQQSVWIVGGAALVLAAVWFGFARHHFPGPPQVALDEGYDEVATWSSSLWHREQTACKPVLRHARVLNEQISQVLELVGISNLDRPRSFGIAIQIWAPFSTCLGVG